MDEFRNIRDLLQQRTREDTSKTFLISEVDGREWSYGEFSETVSRTARLLTEQGIVKGDVVSLLMPNSPEYVIAYFACFSIGAIAGPINSLLKPAEIEWAVRNSESKLLLAESSLRDAAAFPVRGEDDHFPTVLVFDNVDEAAGGYDAEVYFPEISPNDEAIIIYTSGTPANPKAAS